MRKLETQSPPKGSKGFTLIELSIVILIFGIIVTPLLFAYDQYQKKHAQEVTYTNVDQGITQLRLYRATHFFAPCPADRSLASTNPLAGVADCTTANALAVGTCTATKGICRVAGQRVVSTAVAGPPAYTQAQIDSVLIGGYPYRTIATGQLLGNDSGFDGWGNQLTYAVSTRATDLLGGTAFLRDSVAVGQDFKYGEIRAVDENATDTAGTNKDALFVVLSHGKTGRGAFGSGGTRVAACDLTKIDGDNCDETDSKFVRGLGSYEANAPTFYDDYAYFFKDQTGDLWSYVMNPQTLINTSYIYKLNKGNVGVNTGTTPPTDALTVNGDIRAKTTLTNEICDATGAHCLPTTFFYGKYPSSTGSTPTSDTFTTSQGPKTVRTNCPIGYVASGIADSKITCVQNVPIPPPPGGAGADCPVSVSTGLNTYITTILSNGCIVCSDGNTYPSTALCN